VVLVDTDVMIDVIREYPPALAWMSSRSSELLAVPGFVLLELIQGCKDKVALNRVLALAGSCRIVWLSEEASNRAAELFARHRLKHGLGMIDALVGQTSVELGVPIHTFNTKHYACVPGIELVSPYER
jgi:predicted nucleic acid-binding protein